MSFFQKGGDEKARGGNKWTKVKVKNHFDQTPEYEKNKGNRASEIQLTISLLGLFTGDPPNLKWLSIGWSFRNGNINEEHWEKGHCGTYREASGVSLTYQSFLFTTWHQSDPCRFVHNII